MIEYARSQYLPHISLRQTTQRIVTRLLSGSKSSQSLSSSLGSPTESRAMDGRLSWKVLIADASGHSVIHSLFNKSELRGSGVTITMALESKRERMEDVAAVYVLSPTERSIQLCASDVIEKKYAEFRVCFLAVCPIVTLEAFAKALVNVADLSNVFVKDCPLRYVVLERNLFSLRLPKSLLAVNAVDAQSEGNLAFVEDTCERLQDVLSALDMTPSIAYVRSPATERIAQILCKRLPSSLPKRHEANKAHNQILFLVDRNDDLLTPLSIPFTYGGLVMDTLPADMNRVTISEKQLSSVMPKADAQKADFLIRKGDNFFMDLSGDKFWEKYQSHHFAVVCEEIENELASFQKDKAMMATSKEQIASIMMAAPELLERKSFLDKHTILSKILVQLINERALDEYHLLGVEILHALRIRKTHDFTEKIVFRVSSASALGDWKDRIRVLALFTFYTHFLEESGVQGSTRLAQALEGKLIEMFPNHARQTSRILKCVAMMYRFEANRSGQADSHRSPWQWIDRKLTSAAQTLSTTLNANEDHAPLPITEMVSAFLHKDPTIQAVSTKLATLSISKRDEANRRKRILESVALVNPYGSDQLSTEAGVTCVVCVIGGFTYGEYFDVLKWTQKRENRGVHIAFGGSDVLSGEALLNQLGML